MAKASAGTETVTVIPGGAQGGQPWKPVAGEETLALLEHLRLDEDSRRRVLDEAIDVLAKCVPPAVKLGSDGGLVIGYVQSGKTLNFTTVAALARDNGYQIVIVIAGTSLNLLKQSTERLQKDLRLLTRDDRKWLHIETNSLRNPDKLSFRDTLLAWRDPHVPPAARRTILVTAMKHHKHLDRVIGLLKDRALAGVPTLVIDDEADQASLNAKVKSKEETATYNRLKQLRQGLPQHTFLQYTATPQAPLLINIIDILSPRFAELLTPGAEYVGGQDFFRPGSPYIELIPSEHIPTEDHPIRDAPESLHFAMQLFFLGVADGLIKDGGKGNRSMMVHPSQLTERHGTYYDWVSSARETWSLILDPARKNTVDRADLLEEFRSAYEDLKRTATDIAPFDEITKYLHLAVRETRVEEVNSKSGKTPNIKWRDIYPHILVGGQAMDRGFTVEGLTITYMPRGMGIGNADTLQQRARFFGYKRRYLGYCRVFVEATVRDAFFKYVRHEADVRRRLEAHGDEPLTAWKRAFFLNSSLKPTRHSVLDLGYVNSSAMGDEWFVTRRPHESADAVKENSDVVAAFRGRLTLSPDDGDARRTEYQIHDVDHDVPLEAVIGDLLTPFRFTDAVDSEQFTVLRILLSELQPDVRCSVYFMSQDRIRDRRVNKQGQIDNLFQGAVPPKAKNAAATIYKGDRELATSNPQLTVQIHRVNVKDENGKDSKNGFQRDVYALAVYVPQGILPEELLAQAQPAQEP